MRNHVVSTLALLVAVPLSGCTLENGIVDLFSDDPTPVPPVEAVPGAIAVQLEGGITTPQEFFVFDPTGATIEVTSDLQAVGGYYTITAADATQLTGRVLRVVAVSGNKVMKVVIPCLLQADLDAGVQVTMSAQTTAAALAVEALGNYSMGELGTPRLTEYLLSSFASDEVTAVAESVQVSLAAAAGSGYELTQMVEAVLEAGDEASTGAKVFPLAVSSTSLVDDAYLADLELDYTGDGTVDTTGDALEALAFTAAEEAFPAIEKLTFAQYTDPGTSEQYDYIPVVFTAHFEHGCSPIVCGDWIVCDEGDVLFFVGGVHKESPIQDPTLSEPMGNWEPNLTHMYDDGTHGDLVPEDSIWTITFMLPVGLKIGYKYTYGVEGSLWTGTEEWPGNQRILEIVDNNGDGIVWRDDYVGDEESNKDKNNCHPSFGGCNGIIDFSTDLNGDGIPEAQEFDLSYAPIEGGSNLVELDGGCNTQSGYLRYPLITRSTVGQCK